MIPSENTLETSGKIKTCAELCDALLSADFDHNFITGESCTNNERICKKLRGAALAAPNAI